MNKKTLILALSLMLIFTVTMGVTLAYLKTSTTPVVNTFIPAELGSLALDESKTTTDYNNNESDNDYLVVPGQPISKDPRVTFSFTNENGEVVNAYVFVKIDADNWISSSDGMTFTKAVGGVTNGLSFAIDPFWEKLPTTDGTYVYFKAVDVDDEDTHVTNQNVIADNTISVSTQIVKESIGAVDTAGLTFTAYAIQQYGFNSPLAAWSEAFQQS